MLFGIIVRLVVVHHHEQRDAVLGRGPQRARGHQHIAVGLNRHRELAATLERQRRANRCARTVAQAGAAAAAKSLIRLGIIP